MHACHFLSILVRSWIPVVTLVMPVRNECRSIRDVFLTFLSQDHPNWALGMPEGWEIPSPQLGNLWSGHS
jgi:hypothetical protein